MRNDGFNLVLIEFFYQIEYLQHVSSKTGELGANERVAIFQLIKQYIYLSFFLTFLGRYFQFDQFINQYFMLLGVFEDLVFLILQRLLFC